MFSKPLTKACTLMVLANISEAVTIKSQYIDDDFENIFAQMGLHQQHAGHGHHGSFFDDDFDHFGQMGNFGSAFQNMGSNIGSNGDVISHST